MAMGPRIAIAIDMWVQVDGDGDPIRPRIAIAAIDIDSHRQPPATSTYYPIRKAYAVVAPVGVFSHSRGCDRRKLVLYDYKKDAPSVFSTLLKNHPFHLNACFFLVSKYFVSSSLLDICDGRHHYHEDWADPHPASSL